MSTASEGSTVAAMELTDEDKRFIVNHEGGITDDVAHEIVESIRVVPNFPKPVSILSPRLHQLPNFSTLFFSVIFATSLQFLQLLSSVLVPVSSQTVIVLVGCAASEFQGPFTANGEPKGVRGGN